MDHAKRRGYRAAVTSAALGAVITLGLAACSSSSSPSSPTQSSSTPTSSGASSSTPPATASGAGQPADAATVTTVTAAFETFFNPATSTAAATALLQDGPAFAAAIAAEAVTAKAQKTSATVSTVSLKSPNTAIVIFTVLLNGSPVAANQTGYAVHENGTWKVSGQTFCALVSLQGTPPPACQSAAATDLPN